MTDYLLKAIDRDAVMIALVVVVLVGLATIGSFAVGYWIGRASCSHVQEVRR